MPQITLEYTANLTEAMDPVQTLRELHAELAGTGWFVPDDIKSRANRLDQFLVGDGGAEKSFVHLRIHVMERRGREQKEEIGRRALEVLDAHCSGGCTEGRCQVCVEIVDIREDLYFKRIR